MPTKKLWRKYAAGRDALEANAQQKRYETNCALQYFRDCPLEIKEKARKIFNRLYKAGCLNCASGYGDDEINRRTMAHIASCL